MNSIIKKNILLLLPMNGDRVEPFKGVLSTLLKSGFSVDYFCEPLLSLNFGEKYDLLIVVNVYFYEFTSKKTELFLTNYTGRKILLTFDDEYQFNATLFYAQFYDWVLSTDIVSVSRLRQYGFNSINWMHNVRCDDNFTPSKNYLYDISFVGRMDNLKEGRVDYYNALIKEFGSSVFFPRINGEYLPNDKVDEIFKSSKINLNFTGITDKRFTKNNHYYKKKGFKGRPFEIGGQSGFCLSEYSIGLAELLEQDKDIIYFTNEIELINMIKLLLNDNDRRLNISKSLYEKVKLNYSEISPANNLISIINFIFSTNHFNISHKNKKIIYIQEYEYTRFTNQINIAPVKFIPEIFLNFIFKILFFLIKDLKDFLKIVINIYKTICKRLLLAFLRYINLKK